MMVGSVVVILFFSISFCVCLFIRNSDNILIIYDQKKCDASISDENGIIHRENIGHFDIWSKFGRNAILLSLEMCNQNVNNQINPIQMIRINRPKKHLRKH